MRQTFEVWREGYIATGDRSTAARVGAVEAETFADACALLCGDGSLGTFNPSALTVWGCRLFETEAEARRSFG